MVLPICGILKKGRKKSQTQIIESKKVIARVWRGGGNKRFIKGYKLSIWDEYI